MMKPQDTPQLTPLEQAAINRKLIETAIIARAWEDQAFRAKLETDPASALSEAGISTPKGKTIRILSETPDILTLVIPPLPEQTEEVEDEELATVAGGGLIDSGRCIAWDGINGYQARGRISAFEAVLYKGCTVVSGFAGISWGWL